MPTYIVLGNFTDQGIRNIKESPKRESAFRNLCEKAGATVKDAYRTMGRYDVAAIVDAPNDVTMNAIVYSLGSQGNLRTETLRAFTRPPERRRKRRTAPSGRRANPHPVKRAIHKHQRDGEEHRCQHVADAGSEVGRQLHCELNREQTEQRRELDDGDQGQR